MLACGAAPAPMRQFLLNTFNEQSLKRMRKSIDASCAEMQRTLLEHLRPAIELILFRLSEVQAFSKW
jgi:anaphase-promoting complex subunit 4